MIKIKLSELRNIVAETIIEADKKNKLPENKGNKSLDAQIDRYFTNFEKESKQNDDLNIEAFANSVVRLIENFDELLESRSTITRRARWFLSQAHSQDVLSQFDSIMRTEHSIVPGETKLETNDEEFIPPNAERGMPSSS